MYKIRDPKARKRRVHRNYRTFPIFSTTTNGRKQHFINSYVGILHESSVEIPNPQHWDELIANGSFGKGEFSKGEPLNYYKEKRTKAGTKFVERIKRQRYDQHALWKTKDDKDISHSSESVLVCHESDDSDGQQEELRPKLVEMTEKYFIFPEEAFFLVYGIGCLTVKQDQEDLSTAALWSKMLETDRNFPFRYAIYHHFRSKGWVPRSGLKYGVEFLLYRRSPALFHASYAILLQVVNDESLEPIRSENRELVWSDLAAMDRVINHVAKEVMCCYVLVPSALDTSKPECLRAMQIQEMVMTRWVSSRERGDAQKHVVHEFEFP